MSEEKEAQLRIIYMYTQKGKNGEITVVSKRLESFLLEWIHGKKHTAVINSEHLQNARC